MEKITITSKVDTIKLTELMFGGEYQENIQKELISDIGKKISKIIKNKEHEGLIKKEVKSNGELFNIHKIDLTIVNTKDLLGLERENAELKERIKYYKSLGIDKVYEAMNKVEVVSEFLNRLQNLTEEFGEKINE